MEGKIRLIISDDLVRNTAVQFIKNAPIGCMLEIKEIPRSYKQNSLFHVLCTDVSRQVLWADKPRSKLDWKALFVSGHAIATGRPGEVVTGLEGEFCSIRESTAQMGVKRMNSLIEYAQAWAVGNGVRLREVRYSGDYFGGEE